jgi:hypothetical protein
MPDQGENPSGVARAVEGWDANPSFLQANIRVLHEIQPQLPPELKPDA